jgi:hypothetical protein
MDSPPHDDKDVTPVEIDAEAGGATPPTSGTLQLNFAGMPNYST